MQFLLLSHHRSGSNFLTDVLQRHSRISVIDEPLSMHTRLFRQLDLLRWDAAEFDHVSLHPQLATKLGPREFLRDLLCYLDAVPKGSVRGFKETLLFEKLPWLKRAQPSLKVIHLVRDPRAVLNSVLNHHMHRQWLYELVVPRYGRLYNDIPFEVISSDETERCISSWQIRHFEARRGLAGWPHLTVRLEDIVLNPRAELARVSGFLGLTCEDRQLRFADASQRESRGGYYSSFRRRTEVLDGWKRGLSSDQIRRTERRLGLEMERLGYQ